MSAAESTFDRSRGGAGWATAAAGLLPGVNAHQPLVETVQRPEAMARGRRTASLDMQVDKCGDTRLLQFGRPEIEACISSSRAANDGGVVDMGGLAAGAMQAEGGGAILERCFGHDAEVEIETLRLPSGCGCSARSSMILRVSALSAAAWRARAAWRSRSFLSAVGSKPLAMARLTARPWCARRREPCRRRRL